MWISEGPTSLRPAKRGYAYRMGCRARIARVEGHRVIERRTCPHQHETPSAARKCAEAAAKRMNLREAALDKRARPQA